MDARLRLGMAASFGIRTKATLETLPRDKHAFCYWSCKAANQKESIKIAMRIKNIKFSSERYINHIITDSNIVCPRNFMAKAVRNVYHLLNSKDTRYLAPVGEIECVYP